jgi:hypothetical protein
MAAGRIALRKAILCSNVGRGGVRTQDEYISNTLYLVADAYGSRRGGLTAVD